MTAAFWIVAGLLGLFYLYAGGMKLVQSREQLQPMMEWVDTVPMAGVRAIGAIEIIGVAGLLLPPATGIAPALALVAAIGFLVLQVLATALHLSRHEGLKGIVLNLVIIAVTAVVIWLATVW